MAGGPFAANVQCACLGVADRFYDGMEDDHYLCRQCGKCFFICWDREELPKQLFHPEVRKVQPPPPTP